MSVLRSHGKEEILIKGNDFIIVEEKSDDGYEWKSVTFKSTEEECEIFIGSYSIYNYSCSREWMEYNENYIVLLMVQKGGHIVSDTKVKKLFDINSKQLIDGSQEELIEIYNKEFKGDDKKRMLTRK